MFYRLGHVAYRRRYAIIVAWLLLVALSIPGLAQLQGALSGGGFQNGVTEADRALARMQSDLHYFPTSVTIIFSHPTWTVADPRFVSALHGALSGMPGLAHLARIDTFDGPNGSPKMVSPDRHATYAVLNFQAPLETVQKELPRVRARLRPTALRTIITGDPPVYADMERLSVEDLAQVEKYTFPAALLLLVVVFGTLVAAGVPLLIGGVSVAVTLAILYLIARVTTVSTFALNVTTMIGLGIGIDYALLIVSRFREEIARRTIEDAVAVTVAHAGRSVLFSGGTVVLGLSGLLMFKAIALRSMGIGGALVVGVAVVASLTLVPAVLGLLGRRIDALPVLRRGDRVSRFWPATARLVMRYPWAFIVLTLIAVATIAWPAGELRLNIPNATILPTSVESRQGYDILQTTFQQNVDSPIIPVVYGPGPILQPRYIGALYDYTRAIARDRDVASIQSIVNLDPHLTRSDYLDLPAHLADPAVASVVAQFAGAHSTLVAVYPRHGLSKDAAEALARRIHAIPLGQGLRRDLGGYTPGEMDYVGALYSDFPKAILFVIGSTLLVLLALFHSVVLPIKAVVMNSLSLLGSYGALVFIFQQGHLSNLLNFSATGYTDEMTPIVMFCTLFGLSMDYEVFLLSRIQEEYLKGGRNDYAVEQGLARTGRIITSAALILVVVAGSFAFTNLVLVKAVGLGLALAILIDATLIRTLLVPATMRVLGHWNWWAPRWLDHLIGRVGGEMATTEPARTAAEYGTPDTASPDGAPIGEPAVKTAGCRPYPLCGPQAPALQSPVPVRESTGTAAPRRYAGTDGPGRPPR